MATQAIARKGSPLAKAQKKGEMLSRKVAELSKPEPGQRLMAHGVATATGALLGAAEVQLGKPGKPLSLGPLSLPAAVAAGLVLLDAGIVRDREKRGILHSAAQGAAATASYSFVRQLMIARQAKESTGYDDWETGYETDEFDLSPEEARAVA